VGIINKFGELRPELNPAHNLIADPVYWEEWKGCHTMRLSSFSPNEAHEHRNNNFTRSPKPKIKEGKEGGTTNTLTKIERDQIIETR